MMDYLMVILVISVCYIKSIHHQIRSQENPTIRIKSNNSSHDPYHNNKSIITINKLYVKKEDPHEAS